MLDFAHRESILLKEIEALSTFMVGFIEFKKEAKKDLNRFFNLKPLSLANKLILCYSVTSNLISYSINCFVFFGNRKQ
jgi:hypothetical protein